MAVRSMPFFWGLGGGGAFFGGSAAIQNMVGLDLICGFGFCEGRLFAKGGAKGREWKENFLPCEKFEEEEEEERGAADPQVLRTTS